MRFAIFPLHLCKVPRVPRKIDARSYEVLHLSRKIISANLEISGSKMQPLSRNQRRHLLTALMNMSLVLRLPRKMHLCRSCSNVPRLPSFLECYKTATFCSLLTRCTIPCACHAKAHLNLQKVVRTPGAFNILTSKCASRHNGVHFFDMCFAPQRRALFQRLNFQKWSEREVFLLFHLQLCFALKPRALFPHRNS